MNQIGIFILFILFPGSSPSSDRVTVNKVYDLESKLTGVEYVISGVIALWLGNLQMYGSQYSKRGYQGDYYDCYNWRLS